MPLKINSFLTIAIQKRELCLRYVMTFTKENALKNTDMDIALLEIAVFAPWENLFWGLIMHEWPA